MRIFLLGTSPLGGIRTSLTTDAAVFGEVVAGLRNDAGRGFILVILVAFVEFRRTHATKGARLARVPLDGPDFRDIEEARRILGVRAIAVHRFIGVGRVPRHDAGTDRTKRWRGRGILRRALREWHIVQWRQR